VSSVLVEEAITAHHVISPSLARWMSGTQGVPADKIIMAPLAGLTADSDGSQFRGRHEHAPLTVAFVGRMARQKAPEVFVEIAHRLRHSPQHLRFIMHGDGELATWVEDIIQNEGLTDVIVRRGSSVPVGETLEEAHVLVVPSHNEGLTLTTLEALAHGVPVVSTDVGAQSDIVPARALAPRTVHRAVSSLAKKIEWLAADESAREALWRDESEAQDRLLATQSASAWFAQEVRSW
jgi:glycosyltransferase involved in cell wall biosynthesis